MKLKNLFVLPLLLSLSFCGNEAAKKPDVTGLGPNSAQDSTEWKAIDHKTLNLLEAMQGNSYVTASTGDGYTAGTLLELDGVALQVINADAALLYDGDVVIESTATVSNILVYLDGVYSGREYTLVGASVRANALALTFEQRNAPNAPVTGTLRIVTDKK